MLIKQFLTTKAIQREIPFSQRQGSYSEQLVNIVKSNNARTDCHE